MADVRNVCVIVKSLPFPCRRDALDVNKEDRMEEIGMIKRSVSWPEGGNLFYQYYYYLLKYD